MNHEVKVRFCHWIENFFVSTLPGKCLFCWHKVSLWKVFFCFFWVIQFFAFSPAVVCKMQWVNNFVYLKPHFIIRFRQWQGLWQQTEFVYVAHIIIWQVILSKFFNCLSSQVHVEKLDQCQRYLKIGVGNKNILVMCSKVSKLEEESEIVL